MWTLDRLRGVARASWPVSPGDFLCIGIASLGLVGCVETPRGQRVITEPAPPLLEGKPGAGPMAETDEASAPWRDPRDDSKSVEGTGSQGVAAAAREAAAAAARAASGAAPSQRRSSSPSDNVLISDAHKTLDDWHQAAADGDRDRYIGHFALDAVFMGTDATERWDLATFTSYVEQHFRPGAGWTYQPFNRHVTLGPGSQLAWFDEELDSSGYGALRGTGVLRRDSDTWKITHYSMVFTIPNDVARDVVGVVRAGSPAGASTPNR